MTLKSPPIANRQSSEASLVRELNFEKEDEQQDGRLIF